MNNENLKEVVESNLNQVKKRKKTRKAIFSNLGVFFPAFLLFVVLNFFIGLAIVKGSSMEQYFNDGDFVIYNKIANKISRNDILVIKKSGDKPIQIIKRVIGLPYDKVDIIDGYVYINDVKLDESIYTINGITEKEDLKLPVTLKENEYFVLGDNRQFSIDSRNTKTGLINKNQILGRVFYSLRNVK